MRRFTSTLAVAGLLAAVVAGAALAAAPANKSYSGSGRNYWQQNGRWVKHGHGSFHFRTDKPYNCGKNHGVPRGSDCQYITQFTGSYTASCSNRTVHVSASNIPINQKTNAFSANLRSRNNNGARIHIYGSFTRGAAKVNYRVTFVGGCASWVRGTAH